MKMMFADPEEPMGSLWLDAKVCRCPCKEKQLEAPEELSAEEDRGERKKLRPLEERQEQEMSFICSSHSQIPTLDTGKQLSCGWMFVSMIWALESFLHLPLSDILM